MFYIKCKKIYIFIQKSLKRVNLKIILNSIQNCEKKPKLKINFNNKI